MLPVTNQKFNNLEQMRKGGSWFESHPPKGPEGLARFLDYAVADRYSFSV